MTAFVVDASALAEYLVGSGRGRQVATRIEADDALLNVPHLCVPEVASVSRKWVRRQEVSAPRAAAAMEGLAVFPAKRWPAEPFLARIWELRDNITSDDATYVALAEELAGAIITTDARLAAATAQHASCAVELIG